MTQISLNMNVLKSASARLAEYGLAPSSVPREEDFPRLLQGTRLTGANFSIGEVEPALDELFRVVQSIYGHSTGSDSDRALFACTVAREMIQPTRWRLVVADGALAAVVSGQPEAFGAYVVDRYTGNPAIRTPTLFDVERAIIATAMANPVGLDIQALVEDVESLEWLLGTFGIFSFCPILLRDPREGRDRSNGHGLLQLDEAMMAISDIALLLSHPPANGLGVIARLAVELQVPTVLLHGDAHSAALASTGKLEPEDIEAINTLSVMLLDEPNYVLEAIDRSSGAPTMLEHLFALLCEGRLQTSDHRDDRLERWQHAVELVERSVNTLRQMSSYERGLLPQGILSEERWKFLTSHPLNFAGAVGRERAALERLAPTALPDLDEQQRSALFEAQRRGGWNRNRSLQLLQIVRRQMARESRLARDAFRNDTREPAYWLQLDRDVLV